ncbi:hypothetical protein Pan2_84 [Pseudanabaena phage Pan2]|nr:hypothetical protein Pan2_84 [Pseudanabaena phage Pan2]
MALEIPRCSLGMTIREDENMETLPAGITSLEPMPYGFRRWNGTVWANAHVDAYNRQLSLIEDAHRAGYSAQCQRLIDGLYNLAAGFDSVSGDR